MQREPDHRHERRDHETRPQSEAEPGASSILCLLRAARGLIAWTVGSICHEVAAICRPYCPEPMPSARRNDWAPAPPPLVYVAHPFAADPPDATYQHLWGICESLVDEGAVPVAPQLMLPAFVYEDEERETAMELCLRLLERCDQVRVFGHQLSDQMRREIEYAAARGIPVQFIGGPRA